MTNPKGMVAPITEALPLAEPAFEPALENIARFRLRCKQWDFVQRARIGLNNLLGAYKRAGITLPPVMDEHTATYLAELRGQELVLVRAIKADAPLVEDTPGLGAAVYCVMGLAYSAFSPHEPTDPKVRAKKTKSPAPLQRFFGLHVENGHAVRRVRGKKLGFSARLRAYWIYRVAEPTMKLRGCPGRLVYDARRATTLLTHPPMGSDSSCETCRQALEDTKALRKERRITRERTAPAVECATLGGVHWTDGHRHADALRVASKAILRAVWRAWYVG